MRSAPGTHTVPASFSEAPRSFRVATEQKRPEFAVNSFALAPLYISERFLNARGIAMSKSASALLCHLHAIAAEGDGAGNDDQLLERFISQRNDQAFASLMSRYGPLVWRVYRRSLGNAGFRAYEHDSMWLRCLQKSCPRRLHSATYSACPLSAFRLHIGISKHASRGKENGPIFPRPVRTMPLEPRRRP